MCEKAIVDNLGTGRCASLSSRHRLCLPITTAVVYFSIKKLSRASYLGVLAVYVPSYCVCALYVYESTYTSVLRALEPSARIRSVGTMVHHGAHLGTYAQYSTILHCTALSVLRMYSTVLLSTRTTEYLGSRVINPGSEAHAQPLNTMKDLASLPNAVQYVRYGTVHCRTVYSTVLLVQYSTAP